MQRGPNQRAGFMAAPVRGPPIRMSKAIVRPIPNPPASARAASTGRAEHREDEEKVRIAFDENRARGVMP